MQVMKRSETDRTIQTQTCNPAEVKPLQVFKRLYIMHHCLGLCRLKTSTMLVTSHTWICDQEHWIICVMCKSLLKNRLWLFHNPLK